MRTDRRLTGTRTPGTWRGRRGTGRNLTTQYGRNPPPTGTADVGAAIERGVYVVRHGLDRRHGDPHHAGTQGGGGPDHLPNRRGAFGSRGTVPTDDHARTDAVTDPWGIAPWLPVANGGHVGKVGTVGPWPGIAQADVLAGSVGGPYATPTK